MDIGHRSTDETQKKLWIGRSGFLLPEEENKFRQMLEWHGKLFVFTSKEIGYVDPNIVDSGIKIAHSENLRSVEREGSDEDS